MLLLTLSVKAVFKKKTINVKYHLWKIVVILSNSCTLILE